MTAEQKLQAKLDAANAGDEVALTEDVKMDINLNKAISLDLANFKIDGNVSIEDTTFSGEINIKAGTITGYLTVNTPNATVNNEATVDGTITIKDVKSGTWNENVSGNTLVFNAAEKTLNIGAGVKVEALTIGADNAKVTIAETAEVTEFTANSAVTVTGAGNITNAVINADGVELQTDPDKIVLEDGVTSVIIGGESKTPVDIAEESFLTSLAQVESLDDTLYTISYSKAENKVEVEFKKDKLKTDAITPVQTAAKGFINAMFTNEELKVAQIEVLNLLFKNEDNDPIEGLAVNLLATIGEGESYFSKAMNGLKKFLAGTPVKESLDIKVTLEDDEDDEDYMEFTVEGVTAIFKINKPFSEEELKNIGLSAQFGKVAASSGE